MRRLSFVLLSAVALFAEGCKSDGGKNGTNVEMMTFTARIGGGAKTEIVDPNVRWTTGDSIIINGEVFKSELEGDGKTAVFTGKAVDPTYRAFYPAAVYKGENDYALPKEQIYAGTKLCDVNPMYAESSVTDLKFHNVCSLMRLRVTGTGTVKSIKVSADQPLSGKCEMKKDSDGVYYAEVASTGDTYVILNCGDGVDLSSNPTFYIALPQNNYTNLKFTLSNSDASSSGDDIEVPGEHGSSDDTQYGEGTSWESAPFSMNLKAGLIRDKELTGVSL